jgi:isochorismate synthase
LSLLPPVDDLIRFVTEKLVEERNHDRYAIITIPAQLAPLETFLGAVPPEAAFVWHPPRGPAYVGSGITKRIESGDPTTIDAEIEACWSGCVHHVFSKDNAPHPRFFGGVAFAPARNDQDPWAEFGDGSFILPRWTYIRDAHTEQALISLALAPRASADFVEQMKILGELDTIQAALFACEGLSTASVFFRELPDVVPTQVLQQPVEDWSDYVSAIHAGIDRGLFQKVVAARRAEVLLEAPVDLPTIMARLGAELPDTTRFAFARASSTFFGASPELLFSKAGTHVRTEALAGTIRSLGSEFPVHSRQSVHLLQSNKDQREHEFVVRQILEVLKPIAAKVSAPDVPSLRKVGQIIHLLSPIDVEVTPSTPPLHVLAALHPTPAVGGAPRAPAIQFILENESAARGWYTGAVGWVDRAGNATFNVAIRSAVLDASGRRAWIYAGAGIVRESDPEAEYAETALKQQPMLRALGWKR